MELFKASHQWANRPNDERFWDVEEMRDVCAAYRAQAATSTVRYGDLRVEADGEDLRLIGSTGVPAQLTHYAFGQLSTRAEAPAGYLRKLPPTLAAQNLNHGLKQRDPSDKASLLWHKNGGLLLRAALSERYDRIWNCEIADRLVQLKGDGWRTPPARPADLNDPRIRPATEADVMDARGMLSVEVGDMIAPAGVYASDHDMFVFMVNEGRRVDDGSEDGLSRGFFVWNSEVGDASFGVMSFLYKHVCGNHIVWGASGVKEVRIRHIGQARAKAFGKLAVQIRKYADESVSDDEAKIKAAQSYVLGASKAEVVSALLGIDRKRKLGLGKRRLEAAADLAEEREDRYGDPRTLWGVTNALTEASQATPYADERAKIDRAAGKLLSVAF